MAPIYRNFTLTRIGQDWWYINMKYPDLSGTCNSLAGCVQEIDELHKDAIRRPAARVILIACACMVAIYGAIAWGMLS